MKPIYGRVDAITLAGDQQNIGFRYSPDRGIELLAKDLQRAADLALRPAVAADRIAGVGDRNGWVDSGELARANVCGDTYLAFHRVASDAVFKAKTLLEIRSGAARPGETKRELLGSLITDWASYQKELIDDQEAKKLLEHLAFAAHCRDREFFFESSSNEAQFRFERVDAYRWKVTGAKLDEV
jgi:hypothetical protein